jgi:hypothetical protein
MTFSEFVRLNYEQIILKPNTLGWITVACITGAALCSIIDKRIEKNKKKPYDPRTFSDEDY